MKARMVRKASSTNQWAERVALQKDGEEVNVVIEKVITLSDTEFKNFCLDLLEDKNFIKENQDLMKVDENGVWHSLKVVGTKAKGQIIVQSEGYDYARYTSLLLMED